MVSCLISGPSDFLCEVNRYDEGITKSRQRVNVSLSSCKDVHEPRWHMRETGETAKSSPASFGTANENAILVAPPRGRDGHQRQRKLIMHEP